MITGGGTGGHVFPGVAVAREFLKDGESQVLFVGKKNGPEEGWLKEQHIPFEGVSASGLPRGFSFRWLTFGFSILAGWGRAWRLLGSFKPGAVLSTGGYVSVPLSLASLARGVPVFLLEPNVEPGLAARLIALFAKCVFTGFEATVGKFPKKRTAFTGIPVRQEIFTAEREASREAFGLHPGIPTVLIFGGSQGARHLSQAAADALRFIGEGTQPLQAILMTGRADYQAIADTLEKCSLKVAMRRFIPNIHEAYAAADLVVSRAGAMTCAELTARGVPSVLVPYPYAGAHQEKNARALEAAGAARVLLEKDMDGGSLAETMLSILQDAGRLSAMTQKARDAGRPRAAEDIARMIRECVERKQAA
jgi:UDP-N-acetylglucosamine--N-acetylmuramyl-(pentapeptide) pyrophosphoryl-undecaprenol N-acetylglucosamine transferase